MKNQLSNFSLVFLLIFFTFNSCSKDETISTPQKQGQIKVETKEEIDNIDLKNQVEKNLSKIKQLFQIAPPKSMRKSSGKGTENDPINLENIQVNTEAYNIVENENGEVSFTFEVDFPSDSTNVSEIINMHTYYDENNQLKSQLIKYELTNEEFLIATKNQSFDGFWDKISTLDLETTNIKTNSEKSTAARSGDTCTCEGGGSTPTVIWVPYANNSGYGGSSASGASYALPPLNSLPPQVLATLRAAGVFTGINYNNFAPYGYGHNYTSPVRYFSINDITIPAFNSSSSARPFNNYYAYYFSGIKNIIKDYYEKVYASQINSYVTSSQTTIEDHIVKQKAIYDFFQFTYSLYAQNRTRFYYLSSNHELTESIFYFLAKNNSYNYDYTQAKAFSESAIEALMEVGIANYSSNDYPGMDENLSFEWWLDEEFVENNFSFNLVGEGFGDLTTQEKWLVAAFPARALIIYNNKELAETETMNMFGNNGRNDKSDAFRHAFFNAMNSNDAGDTVARLFSNAHESEVTSNLILEVQMDLHNNNVGHTIGDDASIFVSDQDLSSSVYQSLLNGLLVYLSPLDAVIPPNFGINSSTQITPTN